MNKRFTSLAACIVAAGVSLMAQTPVKSDYNGDGKSDIMYFNRTNSAAYELQIFNSAIQSQAMVNIPTYANWVVAASAIEPATGKSDLFWQNKATGQVYKMAMNGLDVDTANSKVVYTDQNADWQLVMAADFNRDGVADLLFRNVQNGQVYLQPLNADGSLGQGQLIYTEPNLSWKPVSVIANPAMPNENDLVWYNYSNGQVYLMQLNANGSVNQAGSKMIYAAASTDWKLVSADDYNRDGNPDLLFWNQKTGDVYVLLLDANYNALPASRTVWNADPTKWQIVATGDYNGDGYADLLWRNVADNSLYQMFMNVDAKGNPQVNTADSNLLYTASSSAWSPVGGITSVSINAPTPDATDYSQGGTIAGAPDYNPADNTNLYSYQLVNPTVIKPGNFPILYVTVGDPLYFHTEVDGPVIDNTVTYKAYSADNATDLTSSVITTATDNAQGTVTGTPNATYPIFESSKAQNVIVLAQSNGDPAQVSARYVSVVAAPGVSTLTASPNTIQPGQSATLSYQLTPGNTGILTNDIDPTFQQVLTSASGTVTVTPAATAHYTLQAINQAGKTTTSTASVTVSAQAQTLDCTITIPGAAVSGGNTYVTSGSVYLVQVPVEAGVTYNWQVQNANILSGQGTNQISVVIGPSGTNPTFTCTKTLNGAFNTGSLSPNVVAAPTTPTSITVGEVGQGTETTYVTAGKTITATAPVQTNCTYNWTVSGATITAGAGTNSITMTAGASGTVSLSVVAINQAGTQSGAKTASRIIVADPTGTKVTVPTGYVTPGVAGNGLASVPSAGPAATYAWTINTSSSGGATAAAVNGSDATPSLSYTLTGGTAGNTVAVSCAIKNGAGDTYTTAAVNQTIAAAPVAPTAITYSAPVTNNQGYVTVGSSSKATVTPGVGQQGSQPYNTMTYTWTVTNATILSGQGTTTITYQPTGTGALTFSVVEVNPANLASSGYKDTTTTITGVSAPVITAFSVSNPVETFGDSANLTLGFNGGVGALVDSLGAASVTGISSNTTSYAFSGLAANDVKTPHTLTFIVTNAAGDFVQKTLTVDVAAAPVATSLAAFTDSGLTTAYTGTAVNYGTALYLQPNYSTNTTTMAGQTVTITPGPINNPAPASANLILPAQGTTTYFLTVTNRAGKSVQQTVKTVVNTVAVTGANQTLAVNGTLDLSTVFSVTGAVDSTYTLSIATDGTGGASLSSTTLTAGPNAGTITVKAVSNADPSKSKTITITVS
jgi:hypothetical protein